jgi:uncharacterized membrane protein YkvA (DUF1232 family)
MKKSPPATLARFLSPKHGSFSVNSLSEYVANGAACVTLKDRQRLRRLLPSVRTKTMQIKDSMILRNRLELLAQFVEESGPEAESPAHREASFALYYFLKGYDLLPDSLPEIGLLDDAQLVETVLRRNEHDLRGHWAARKRAWAAGA